ncbi:hypothetical protein POX_b03394 [Penicillium oxalicum]|uniref:gamma-glutamylcyclotransferase n=1 Tax=Penicillium oxalicum (strain 114-2 / CGMCC 5302) TaxID=933388 RepID=S7ZLL2_PENO1|nr:hypothetical protein POX_b03394 [Penicillium oxalicum]EPS29581.1 hypothetical protein PDE_04531 [Penicillium oxalicum 114-2]KAI2793340.1 hypothetical protein POX_b03394 [Penicillium oxalicum]
MTSNDRRRADEEEAPPDSSHHFNAIEPLRRLEAALPLGSAQSAPIDATILPTTTSARRRASVVSSALDGDIHLSEKVAEQQESGHALTGTSAEQETVLYLAYGSNLASQTFRGMRGIKPLSEIPVLIPELRLTFDLPGIPYAEPCFAGTQYRDPDLPTDAEPHQHGNVSETEDDMVSEKAPLLSGTQEVRRTEASRKRWHKPLIGVVYEVTLADYAKIIATEGGGRGYRDVVINCYPFAEGFKSTDPVPDHPDTTPFKAHTLLSPGADDARKRIEAAKRGHSAVDASVTCTSSSKSSFFSDFAPQMRPDPEYAQPSARYLNLLVTGAAEHDLPVSYREYLSQIHTYRITTVRQKIGKFVFVGLWAPAILSLLTFSKRFAGPDGRSPPWLVNLSNILISAMWYTYDMFFKPVYGDGERTLGDVPSI